MAEKTLHDKILDAQSQISMLEDTAHVIYMTDAVERLDAIWFEGLRISLEQIEDVLHEVIGLGEETLNKLQEADKGETDTQ